MFANGRRADWQGGAFVPNGTRVGRGTGGKRLAANLARWKTDEPIIAARIFVGFNVGDEPVYGMEDLIRLVKSIRTEQTGNPSSTFVAQRGIYMHDDGHHVVEEDGAQVIILHLGDESTAEFKKQMTQLAENVAYLMQQEEVVIEIQKGGVTQEVIGVGA